MTVEITSGIGGLDATLPAAGDPKSEGDNHLRLIKGVLKTQFPNFGTAAMNATTVELNYMVGVTSAVQAQLNSKGAIAGQTWTGAHDFTGGSVNVPTATAGDNSTKAASTAFATNLAFATALPAQSGNSGKFITTDGSTASWSSTLNGSLTFGGTGRRIIGDLENFTRANRLLFTNSGTATNASLGVTPSVNGGSGGAFEAFARVDPDNSAYAALICNQLTGVAGLNSAKTGTGTALPLALSILGVEAARIDTSTLSFRLTGGGGLGYGTGSGGTVTQTTSKSTAVTLNKPAGQITTNNAALAANTEVNFTLNNSSIEAGDNVIIGGSNAVNYMYRVGPCLAGQVAVFIKNISAGSLSDALVIDFKVIKGATS
ncbi:hypothetical protein [Acidovorax sp.]|uniref:hypothetical protein n=1 Tax=Acidovorax sp. TaxID=1872122 RepID=UPI0031D43C72